MSPAAYLREAPYPLVSAQPAGRGNGVAHRLGGPPPPLLPARPWVGTVAGTGRAAVSRVPARTTAGVAGRAGAGAPA